MELLIQFLKYDIEFRICGAVKSLEFIGEPARKALVKGLKDEDWFVRRYVAMVLGKIGGEGVIEALREALKDKHYIVQYYVAEAYEKLGGFPANDIEKAYYFIGKGDWDGLIELGEPAVEPLRWVFSLPLVDEGESINLRYVAACTLGKMGDEQMIKHLIQDLENENEDILYRIKAAETLGNIGDKRAVIPLINTLKDKIRNVRYYAAWGLEKLGWEPKNENEKAHYLIAKEQWDELTKLGKVALEPLKVFMNDIDEDIQKATKKVLKEVIERNM